MHDATRDYLSWVLLHGAENARYYPPELHRKLRELAAEHGPRWDGRRNDGSTGAALSANERRLRDAQCEALDEYDKACAKADQAWANAHASAARRYLKALRRIRARWAVKRGGGS